MARHRVLQPDIGSSGVQLLSDVVAGSDGPGSSGRSRPGVPIVASLIAAVGLALGFMAASPGPLGDPEPGRAVTLGFRFGDPFAVEWYDLSTEERMLPPVSGPQPMVGVAGTCIGFGRSDWPEGRRHPSVAHCLDADSVGWFEEAGVVGVHRIMAGQETWYFLFFDGPVTALDIDVDLGVEGSAGQEVSPTSTPIYRRRSVAAILVPVSTTEIRIEWRRAAGGRYQAPIL